MLAFKSSSSNYCCSGQLIVRCSPGTLLQFYSCWILPAIRRKKEPFPSTSPSFSAPKIWRYSLLRQRNSRYLCSDQNVLLMNCPKIGGISTTRTWKPLLVSSVPFQNSNLLSSPHCLIQGYDDVMPNTSTKE